MEFSIYYLLLTTTHVYNRLCLINGKVFIKTDFSEKTVIKNDTM